MKTKAEIEARLAELSAEWNRTGAEDLITSDDDSVDVAEMYLVEARIDMLKWVLGLEA